MPVRVVFINGSPRKNGKTVEYLREVMKWVKKAGGKTKFLHLVDFNILPCLGCYSVSPKNCTFPCKQKDDMEKIYPILLEADAIVFGSPSYWFSPSGIAKNFVDRLTSLENNGFLLKGKIFSAIGVAEESGGEEVSQKLISIFNEMGCIIPAFGAPFFNKNERGNWKKKDLRDLGENIVKMARILKKEIH